MKKPWQILAVFLSLLTWDASGRSQAVEPYKLRVGDFIFIQVLDSDLPRLEIEIRKDGSLTPQLLKPMKMAGLTIREAQKALTNAYAKVLPIRYPRVSVMVMAPCGRKN